MSRRTLFAWGTGSVLAVVVILLIVRQLRSRAGVGPLAPEPGTPAAVASAPIEAVETIYDGGFSAGWEDWGWGPHEIANRTPARIQFTGYGGIVLRHSSELPSRFGALAFRVRAPAGFGEFFDVALKYQQLDESLLPRVSVEGRYVVDVGDGWKQVVIPWAELNPRGTPFEQIVIKANRMVGPEWVLLDKIVLTRPMAGRDAGGPPPVRPGRVRIACDETAIAINPLIYGISQGAWTSGETAHRVGGNPMSRLNWELGAWNSANDWYFENVKSDSGLGDWIDEAYAHGVKMAVVVPMLGWVAKDGTSVGFPVAQFGAQKAHDPNRPEAGDGNFPSGSPIRPGLPSLTSVEAPPETIRRWVEMQRKRDSDRGGRRVQMYILDNEPSLWNKTHRDVHPAPVSYDELLDRTIRYGTAIREADPGALIAGPAEWGWSGYFFSAKDTAEGWLLHSDRDAHGGVPLLPWYLQRLEQHERRTGVRILDVVDVHFYPQGEGIYKDARTDADTAALRLRSTRALWDPTYRDESWIKEHVNLIPRLKDWIAKNYPGRGISLGEWSFGAEGHISGALAIAEALGRFGQQGLTSAFYWAKLVPGTPGFNAFLAYRNFDGKGARFLDWSVPTQSADGVSLFASRDESGSHIVAVVLNLDPVFAADLELDTGSCGMVASRRVFSYDASSARLTEEPAHTDRNPHELLAPYSLKVIDMNVTH